MLNTRLSRCAHWSGCPGAAEHRDVRERPLVRMSRCRGAQDVRERPGHGGTTLGRGLLLLFLVRLKRVAFASFGRGYQRSVLAVGGTKSRRFRRIRRGSELGLHAVLALRQLLLRCPTSCIRAVERGQA